MTTALTERPTPTLDAKAIEQVLLGGDLSKLSPDQRLAYYNSVCESLGLNPLTKPFDYITLNGKLTLYARKDATEQLRKLYHISVAIKAREVVEGCYIVTAQARMPSLTANGDTKQWREDESIGAVPIENVKGEARSNAMMKAETKAKRRVTLSICGLGMLDEIEVASIPGVQVGEPQPMGDASWKASAAEKKARTAVPAGVLYIDEIVPHSKGNREWAELTLSNGELVVANAPQLITLAYNVAQEHAPVELKQHVNSKGNQQLDGLDRWTATPAAELPILELTAEDIPF